MYSHQHATACHLLYLIATPALYKWQVERIAKCSNILGLTNPLVGLLSRLKSLRPDLVPQTMPHQSSALSFPRLPLRFREALLALSEQLKESGHSVLLVGNDRKKVKQINSSCSIIIIQQFWHYIGYKENEVGHCATSGKYKPEISNRSWIP